MHIQALQFIQSSSYAWFDKMNENPAPWFSEAFLESTRSDLLFPPSKVERQITIQGSVKTSILKTAENYAVAQSANNSHVSANNLDPLEKTAFFLINQTPLLLSKQAEMQATALKMAFAAAAFLVFPLCGFLFNITKLCQLKYQNFQEENTNAALASKIEQCAKACMIEGLILASYYLFLPLLILPIGKIFTHLLRLNLFGLIGYSLGGVCLYSLSVNPLVKFCTLPRHEIAFEFPSSVNSDLEYKQSILNYYFNFRDTDGNLLVLKEEDREVFNPHSPAQSTGFFLEMAKAIHLSSHITAEWKMTAETFFSFSKKAMMLNHPSQKLQIAKLSLQDFIG